jgi:hypothetical protein
MGVDSADNASDKDIQGAPAPEWTDEDERRRRASLKYLDGQLQRMREDELRWGELRRLVDRAGLE